MPPRPDPDASERELDAWVNALCDLHGWSRYHVVRPEHGRPGFPDLTISRGEVYAVIEEKRSKGARGGEHDQHVNVKPEQAVWLDAAARARWLLAAVWRPTDAVRIEEFLSGERPDPPGLWWPGQVRPLL